MTLLPLSSEGSRVVQNTWIGRTDDSYKVKIRRSQILHFYCMFLFWSWQFIFQSDGILVGKMKFMIKWHRIAAVIQTVLLTSGIQVQRTVIPTPIY